MAVVAIADSDMPRYLAAIESRLCRLPPGTRRTRPCVCGWCLVVLVAGDKLVMLSDSVLAPTPSCQKLRWPCW